MPDATRLVVIGASAGGVSALDRLLSGLGADFHLAIAIVLHVGSEGIGALGQLFGRHCALPVLEAGHGMAVEGGHVYLAPGGYHLLVERDRSFALSVDDKVCYVRPAADVLFSTAADAYGARCVGVVLTGTNDDGAKGLVQIREAGGLALVQDPDDAEEPAMPRAALQLAGADAVLDIAALAARLNLESKRTT